MPGRLRKGHVISGREAHSQGKCHHCFHCDSDGQHQLQHGERIARVEAAAFDLRGHAVAQSESPASHEPEERCRRHDPEAPDLEEDHYGPLPGDRPIYRSVLDDKAGYRHGRNSREEGRKQGRARAVGRGKRKAEDHGSQQDKPEEEHRYEPDGIA